VCLDAFYIRKSATGVPHAICRHGYFGGKYHIFARKSSILDGILDFVDILYRKNFEKQNQNLYIYSALNIEIWRFVVIYFEQNLKTWFFCA